MDAVLSQTTLTSPEAVAVTSPTISTVPPPPVRVSIVCETGFADQHNPERARRSLRLAIASVSKGGPMLFTPRHPKHAPQHQGGQQRHIVL
jgi:hypothetical protein